MSGIPTSPTAAAGQGSPDRAAKLEVIRKLLAKAERAATADEAEAYTAKAVQLCARHGVDAALLAAADPGTDPVGGTRMPVPTRYSAAHARLLGWVSDALGCRAVLHGLSGGRVAAVTVFGHASDRERVALLHASLLLQARAQVDALRPPDPGESVAAYRRSWLYGFAAEVHRRLVAAERAAAAEASGGAPPPSGDATAGDATEGAAPGSALEAVLADRRDRVDEAYATAYPALGAARRSTFRGTGFGAGTVAGARADLGGQRVGPAPVRALGV